MLAMLGIWRLGHWRFATALLTGCLILAGALPPSNAKAEGDPLAELRGLVERGEYALSDSIVSARMARIEATHPLDSLALARHLALLLDIKALRGTRVVPEWIRMGRRGVTLFERTRGADDPELAPLLKRLGSMLVDSVRLDEARPLLERALRISERSNPSSALTAKILVNLAVLERDAGHGREARAYVARGMRIMEDQLGSAMPFVFQNVNSIIDLTWNTGDYAEARDLFERGFEIWDRATNGRHPEILRVVIEITMRLAGGGDWRVAAPYFDRALEELGRALGPRHPDVALAYNGVGVLYLGLGDFERAERLHHESLKLGEAALGPDHPDVALLLHNLSRLANITGRQALAESLEVRALHIRERTFGPHHPLVAISLSSLAGIHRSMGDLRSSRAEVERTLAISRSAYGRMHPDVAAALSSLAEFHVLDKQHQRGLELLREADQILVECLGPAELGRVNVLMGIGLFLRELGDPARALAAIDTARAIVMSQAGPQHSSQISYEAQRAMALSDLGRHEEALLELDRDLPLLLRDFGPDSPGEAVERSIKARVLARLGRYDAAFREAITTERIARTNTRLLARSLAERFALEVNATRISGIGLALATIDSAGAADPLRTRLAWDALIRSRGLILDELSSRNRFAAAEPSLREPYDAWVAASAALANYRFRGRVNLSEAHYSALIDSAQAREDRAQAVFARRGAEVRRTFSRNSVGLDEVGQALPRGAALVAFATYRPLGDAPNDTKAPLHYAAFVLRGGSAAPRFVDVGPVRPIDSAVEAWRAWASNPRSGWAATPRAPAKVVSLRHWLWDSIQSGVASDSVVWIVPEGALALLNWSALPDSTGRFLLEDGPAFQYLAAERDLPSSSVSRTDSGGLLAVGGAEFGPLATVRSGGVRGESTTEAHQPRGVLWRSDPTRCEEFGRLKFEPLQGATREARGVCAFWHSIAHDARGPSFGVGPLADTLLFGSDASERAFRQLAGGFRVLHVATHGFFIDPRCMDPMGEAAETDPDARFGNPLLLSGIALADANRRASVRDGHDDGILTSAEICTLDLSRVEWAVLSACNTGLGTLAGGEGVLGIRRAFEVAGAQAVIMTLWAIPDVGSERYMAPLYRSHFLDGQMTALAVRAAARDVLARARVEGRGTDLSLWGAFIPAGGAH